MPEHCRPHIFWLIETPVIFLLRYAMGSQFGRAMAHSEKLWRCLLQHTMTCGKVNCYFQLARLTCLIVIYVFRFRNTKLYIYIHIYMSFLFRYIDAFQVRIALSAWGSRWHPASFNMLKYRDLFMTCSPRSSWYQGSLTSRQLWNMTWPAEIEQHMSRWRQTRPCCRFSRPCCIKERNTCAEHSTPKLV